jgi:hypothetical protein
MGEVLAFIAVFIGFLTTLAVIERRLLTVLRLGKELLREIGLLKKTLNLQDSFYRTHFVIATGGRAALFQHQLLGRFA